MKAILTKYLGPTNHRPSRIKAIEPDGKSIIINYDYGLDEYELHKSAAVALCDKLGWGHQSLVGGGIKEGMAWVFS